MTPLEKAEALYEELAAHYGEGEDREIRAAAKLLLVALAEEYLDLLKHDPDKFGRILHGNRGRPSGQWLA
jgi:hypothetical protein